MNPQKQDNQKLIGKNYPEKGCLVKNSLRDVAPLAYFFLNKVTFVDLSSWIVCENLKPQMKTFEVRELVSRGMWGLWWYQQGM